MAACRSRANGGHPCGGKAQFAVELPPFGRVELCAEHTRMVLRAIEILGLRELSAVLEIWD